MCKIIFSKKDFHRKTIFSKKNLEIKNKKANFEVREKNVVDSKIDICIRPRGNEFNLNLKIDNWPDTLPIVVRKPTMGWI